jgi:hypothetical protein
MDPDYTWEFQGPRVEYGKEYLRPETGWTCMKLIPHGQAPLSVGLTPSLIDDCVFFLHDIIFIVYVDYGIFLGSINPGNRGLSGADKQGRYLLLLILHKFT